MRMRNVAIFSAAILAGALAGSLSVRAPLRPSPGSSLSFSATSPPCFRPEGSRYSGHPGSHRHAHHRRPNQFEPRQARRHHGFAPEIRPGCSGEFRRAPRHHVYASPGTLDNLEEIKSRLGKLQPATRRSPEFRPERRRQDLRRRPGNGNREPHCFHGWLPRNARRRPSADTLYSNGLRDITSGKYDLARSEFQDYLKYYGDTDLASKPSSISAEISFKQKQFADAVASYEKS